ncbi:Roe1 [Trypoxylus dichotomus]
MILAAFQYVVIKSNLKDDPVNLKSLIGKSVNVITIDKEIHEGVIYVVDPISKTVILLNESKKSLKLLMSHAIASLEIKHEENGVASSFYNNALLFGSDIEERRIRLKNWFKKNLIDVSEDGTSLKIQDVFSISPPYTIDQCSDRLEFIQVYIGIAILMALISARTIIKCGQLINETLFKSLRPTNAIRNLSVITDEQKKQEQATPLPPTETETKPNEELEKLNKEISELTVKNNELLDKYKRALADGENLRVRLTKQISEAKIYGIQNFCKDLLDVADVLNKATESVPREEINKDNPYLKSLYEGLIMTEAQLQTVFKRHGLETVNPIGEKFNPNFHEALFQQDVEGKESGTVVVVSKIGYKLHNRVVRPALVGVAK